MTDTTDTEAEARAAFMRRLTPVLEREITAAVAPLHDALDRIEIRVGAVNGAIAAQQAIAARKAAR